MTLIKMGWLEAGKMSVELARANWLKSKWLAWAFTYDTGTESKSAHFLLDTIKCKLALAGGVKHIN